MGVSPEPQEDPRMMEMYTYDHFADRPVFDVDGNKLGVINDIYYDNANQRPQWGLLNLGLFGTRHTFVPLLEARLVGEEIHLPYARDLVTKAPTTEGLAELAPEDEDRLAMHYRLGYDTAPAVAPAASEPAAMAPILPQGSEEDAVAADEQAAMIGRPSQLERFHRPRTVDTSAVSDIDPVVTGPYEQDIPGQPAPRQVPQQSTFDQRP
jgi:hypothetical protein